jgi:nicotinamidase-related amidase
LSGALLQPGRAALVIVDVQEGFRPAVLDFDRVAHNVGVLAQAARILDLPVVVSEQYPQGLGPTVPEVADHLDGAKPLEKVCFSAADAHGFDLQWRDQALICGIESHVCVWQTAQGLLERGVEVHVARDAVTSRTAENRDLGLQRMEGAGATPTSVETALFELLRGSDAAEFKRVQELVK